MTDTPDVREMVERSARALAIDDGSTSDDWHGYERAARAAIAAIHPGLLDGTAVVVAKPQPVIRDISGNERHLYDSEELTRYQSAMKAPPSSTAPVEQEKDEGLGPP